MHARDDDAAFAEHDGGERFGATNRRRAANPCLGTNRIVLADRGRVDNQFGIVRVFSAMLQMKAETEALQPLGFYGQRFIGSAHRVAKLEQQRRDAAHPAAGDADQMHAMPFLRQEFLQIEIRRGHRVMYIAPSFRQPTPPHFSA